MQALLDVIVPVFVVIGCGYISVWKGFFSSRDIDGLMKFTQNFAIPCLLFKAMSEIDLQSNFQINLLAAFYGGATISFFAGVLGARYLFARNWEDSIAIGFCCLFSNSVVLGLSVTERAYGPEVLTTTFIIVAFHAPFCYGLGIFAMEIARNRSQSPAIVLKNVAATMFRNALVIGTWSPHGSCTSHPWSVSPETLTGIPRGLMAIVGGGNVVVVVGTVVAGSSTVVVVVGWIDVVVGMVVVVV